MRRHGMDALGINAYDYTRMPGAIMAARQLVSPNIARLGCFIGV
jgi:hypothetical protein